MRRIDNSAQTWSEAGRTLVVQPLPGIGDMVWHVPQIHALAATTASRRVDLLTKPRSQAQHLFRADPSVERILWLERETAHRGLRGLWCLVRLLRAGNYQRVWILHGSARYALAAWLAGIPQRIGYGIGAQSWLLNGRVALPAAYRHAHPIQRARALLELLHIPCPEVEPRLLVAAAARDRVLQQFATWPQPWIALGIGSSEACKQWGAERFAALAVALAARASIFIVGGSAERELGNAILQRCAGAHVADALALPLTQTAALLEQCCAYIGNDTGVLNMAAALETPAIGLFGASAPLTHSRWIHALIPQAPATGMDGISVAQVLEYLERVQPCP